MRSNQGFLKLVLVSSLLFASSLYAADETKKTDSTEAIDCGIALAIEPAPASYNGLTVVLDTNVIMNDPYALLKFPGAHIVLPGTVLEELDKHKGDPKLGFTVREFSRQLRNYLTAHAIPGSVSDIPIKGGGRLSIDMNPHNDLLNETSLDKRVNDNHIVATALAYRKKLGHDKVIMISNDVAVFIKATALGLRATEFNPGRNLLDQVAAEAESENNGELRQVEISDNAMEHFKQKGELLWPEAQGLRPNQFIQLISPSTPANDGTVARYIYARPKPIFKGAAQEKDPEYLLPVKNFAPDTLRVFVNGDLIQNIADNASGDGGWYYNGKNNSVFFQGEKYIPTLGARVEIRAQTEDHRVERLKTFEQLGIRGVQARSLEQVMALNVLLDDSIDLVFMEGRAGTSKTFSAVLAAMKMMEGDRKKVLLTRAPVYLGNHDPGALPGGIEEKFGKWNEAVLDSIDSIQAARDGAEEGRRKTHHTRELPNNWLIEPFNFIRGRTFSRITLIVDETQNMTEHEMKTVLTRIGERAKFIVMGDVRQVDVPYMNATNNGLAVAINRLTKSERMTPERQSYVAVVKLRKGVRSIVSEIVSDVFEDANPQD